MTQQGLAVAPICGEDFRAYIKRQHAKYERAIKEAGIKAE
jgi:tripartite-type tricarboxylate transporter receptor subunit TctC